MQKAVGYQDSKYYRKVDPWYISINLSQLFKYRTQTNSTFHKMINSFKTPKVEQCMFFMLIFMF